MVDACYNEHIQRRLKYMNLEAQLQELKMDYMRLQGDLEKRESTGQHVDPLIRQLEALEQEIAIVRQQLQNAPHEYH